jgi:hypothetical protein
MQTEPGDIVDRLPSIVTCGCDSDESARLGREAADTITNLRTEHATAMSEIAVLLVENERLREKSSSEMLSAAAVQAIREMLAGFGVPKAAFIDDHVMNGLAWARMQGLEEAAVIIEQIDGAIPNRQELAASVRSLANTGKEDRGC